MGTSKRTPFVQYDHSKSTNSLKSTIQADSGYPILMTINRRFRMAKECLRSVLKFCRNKKVLLKSRFMSNTTQNLSFSIPCNMGHFIQEISSLAQ